MTTLKALHQITIGKAVDKTLKRLAPGTRFQIDDKTAAALVARRAAEPVDDAAEPVDDVEVAPGEVKPVRKPRAKKAEDDLV